MAAKPLPDVAYLRECFDYDPETGVLTWRVRPRSHFATERGWRQTNGRDAGKPAGTAYDAGHGRFYIKIGVDGTTYMAHRLAWAFEHDTDPGPLEIDHASGDGLDNRAENLRIATHAENIQNSRQNMTGRLKGAGLSKGGPKWRAHIGINGKFKHLGMFDTEEEAHAAYCAAAKERFGKFARFG